MEGPYNHGYLWGKDTVPFDIQSILDEKSEIAGEHEEQ